jgi:hypothetical protein
MKIVSAALLCAMMVLVALSSAHATSYTYTDLAYAGAPYTTAMGINNAGTIVGYIGNPHGQSAPYQGFVLSGRVYTTLSFPGATHTLAYGISNSGAIVGRYQDTAGWHGFVLDQGVYTGFDYPGAAWTDAYGINRISNSGTIVGTYCGANCNGSSPVGWNGYTLTGVTYTTLNYPSASTMGTFLWDINNSGTIVGTYYNETGTHGLILNDGTWTTFDYPGASGSTNGVGISDNGAIVGYTGTGTGFTLSDGIFSPLDHPGMDINSGGQVVGWYDNAQGGVTGFLATPIPEPCHVPEPSVMLFLTATLIGFVGIKRTVRK